MYTYKYITIWDISSFIVFFGTFSWLIWHFFFLAFIYSCTTVEVAREAGKVIKSIDNTITTSQSNKSDKKEKEIKQQNKKEEKENRIKQQKELSKLYIIGKDQNQLFSILGRPDLIRESGNIISIRFDNEECIAYAYISKDDKKKIVKYFEIRSKNGRLISKKSDINYCLKAFT